MPPCGRSSQGCGSTRVGPARPPHPAPAHPTQLQDAERRVDMLISRKKHELQEMYASFRRGGLGWGAERVGFAAAAAVGPPTRRLLLLPFAAAACRRCRAAWLCCRLAPWPVGCFPVPPTVPCRPHPAAAHQLPAPPLLRPAGPPGSAQAAGSARKKLRMYVRSEHYHQQVCGGFNCLFLKHAACQPGALHALWPPPLLHAAVVIPLAALPAAARLPARGGPCAAAAHSMPHSPCCPAECGGRGRAAVVDPLHLWPAAGQGGRGR